MQPLSPTKSFFILQSTMALVITSFQNILEPPWALLTSDICSINFSHSFNFLLRLAVTSLPHLSIHLGLFYINYINSFLMSSPFTPSICPALSLILSFRITSLVITENSDMYVACIPFQGWRNRPLSARRLLMTLLKWKSYAGLETQLGHLQHAL